MTDCDLTVILINHFLSILICINLCFVYRISIIHPDIIILWLKIFDMIAKTWCSSRQSVSYGKSRLLLSLIFFLLVICGVCCTSLKRFAYEGFGRDRWQYPEQVIRVLEIQTGQHIADLGSGSGYFTFRLVDAVGPNGKVYAVDVDQGMNTYIEKQAKKRGYQNIEIILAQHHDPLIPEDGVDLIFTCNTYHHIKDRVAYFSQIQKYLRPSGRIAIIDFNGKGWFQKIFPHFTAGAVIKKEMGSAGYRLQHEFGFLPRQHFLVFSRDRE
ncbi:MAG: class I SAM-dependent methyltransferase [Candidatus Brocadia sp.]|nr:class I SAM-dependent methyltransferase [Candidatus Brocadia sp.]